MGSLPWRAGNFEPQLGAATAHNFHSGTSFPPCKCIAILISSESTGTINFTIAKGKGESECKRRRKCTQAEVCSTSRYIPIHFGSIMLSWRECSSATGRSFQPSCDSTSRKYIHISKQRISRWEFWTGIQEVPQGNNNNNERTALRIMPIFQVFIRSKLQGPW